MTQSLFERLGGRPALKSAVDIFYKNVLADERISYLFNQTDMEGLMQHQYSFMAHAFGDDEVYNGKTLRAAHKHLELTEEHFTAVAECLKSALEELNVDPELQNEVMGIVASTHDDILGL